MINETNQTRQPSPLGVVIVTYESEEVLVDCLESLQLALEDIDARVVVVDNGSSDSSRDIADDHPLVEQVINTRANLGYAAAINRGIREFQAESNVLILNPDVRLEVGALQHMSQGLAGRIGIVTPLILGLDGTPDTTIRHFPSGRRIWRGALFGGGTKGTDRVTNLASYQISHVVDWTVGAVWLISASCRQAVGSWDERYFLYEEETDFARRANDLGFDLLFEPRARAVHLRGDLHDRSDLWQLLQFNKWVYMRKHHGRLRAFEARIGLLVGDLLRSPRGQKHRRSAWTLATGRAPELLRNRAPGKPDLVLLSGFDWWNQSHAFSDFQVVGGLNGDRKVLFVNGIGLRMPTPGKTANLLPRALRKLASTIKLFRSTQQGKTPVGVLSPLSVPVFNSPRLAKWNAISVRFQIRLAMRMMGLRDPACVVCLPSFDRVVEGMNFTKLIFYRKDKHSAFREADPEVVEKMEHSLFEQADKVLYSSRDLMEAEKSLVGDKGQFLDHGVDTDLFVVDGPIAEEFDKIPEPRLGYFGLLRDHSVDFELIASVAREIPEASVVLVGRSQADLSELTKLPNVYLIGVQPHHRIPEFGRGFNVALLPLLSNEFALYQTPIKLKEYLALGLPVVSTGLLSVAPYADYIRISSSSEEFVSLVQQTIEDGGLGDVASRSAVGRRNSWEMVSTKLANLIDDVD